MSSADRRRVSQELVDKIDALVGGHERQRTYEPEIDPAWEDDDLDLDDWEDTEPLDGTAAYLSLASWSIAPSTLDAMSPTFVVGDFKTFHFTVHASFTFCRRPVPWKRSKHQYGRGA